MQFYNISQFHLHTVCLELYVYQRLKHSNNLLALAFLFLGIKPNLLSVYYQPYFISY